MLRLRYRISAALSIAIYCGFVAAQAELTTRDWDSVSSIAHNRSVPIVVVVVGNDCGHCRRLAHEFLDDPTIQSFLGERALVYFYHESTGGKITDFDDERVRARIFISRYAIFATPTLLFLGSDGRPIADPLVGYNDPVNYRDLVTGRLDQAQLALEVDNGPSDSAVASHH